jgi:mannose-6-phosphate isomerase-like protein (cupin superfamily)
MTIQTAAKVFAPIGLTEFLSDYLERDILHLERKAPELVKGIFDLESMGHCVRYMKPQVGGNVRVVPKGEDPEETVQLNAMVGASEDKGEANLTSSFAMGKTIIFNGAEAYWPPVERIIDDLKETLACDIKCNVYCTPPQSQGFDTHVDGHDVLVLQTDGSKTWRLHEVDSTLPLESTPLAAEMFSMLEASKPNYGDPVREVTLHPGDLLYLPRGVPHSAASTTEHSIHLTIGLYPLRRHEFLSRLVDLLAFEDEGLRRRVSTAVMKGEEKVTSAGDMFRELGAIADGLETPIDVDRLVAISSESYARAAGTHGSFESAIGVESMSLETVIQRPEGCSWIVRKTPMDYRIRCGGSMSVPLKLSPVMGFFEKNPVFRIGDAPDLMADDAKLTLCRNLVRNGVMRISKKPAPEIQKPVPAAASGNDLSWLLPNAGF